MRLMDQPIADRIRDAGLANGGVPRRWRQLAGNERRGAFAPIFNDFQQVPAFRIGERREEPIIDREEIELGVFRQKPGIRSVAATDGELVQEPRRADVGGGEPPSPVPPSGLSLRSLEPHGNPLLNNEVLI